MTKTFFDFKEILPITLGCFRYYLPYEMNAWKKIIPNLFVPSLGVMSNNNNYFFGFQR